MRPETFDLNTLWVPTVRVLTVLNADPTWRSMSSVPADGALPHTETDFDVRRVATSGKRNAVAESLGRPSMKWVPDW